MTVKKIAFFIFGSILCPTYTTAQTCIISVICADSNVLFVAMDSRVVVKNAEVDSVILTTKIDTVCKMKKIGNVYMTGAGPNMTSAFEIGAECVKAKKTIREIANEFAYRRKYDLINYLMGLYDRHNLKNAQPYVQKFQALFFAVEDTTVTVASVDISLKSKDQFPIVLADTIAIQEFNPRNWRYFHYAIIGASDVAGKIFLDNAVKLGYIKAMKLAIIEQSKANPVEVSPPIEIFRLNKKGFTWIENPLHCTVK